MSYALRPYQDECLKRILLGVKNGSRLQLMSMATGLGKTVVFANLPQYVKKSGKKTLVLAHREELLGQAQEKINAINPELTTAIEQAENHAEPEADVVIASVQTIGRTGSERIKKFNPEHFGLIIIDEAHHATAGTYKNVLSYFGANKEEGVREGHPVVLGVTATPFRKDNVGLDTLFDEIVFKYDIWDGIKNGFLANIKAFTVFTDEKVSAKMIGGDFAVGELSREVNTPNRNQLVVDSYKKISPDEIALCFAVDVQHANDLADTFIENGVEAEVITGGTPDDERKRILEDFESGVVKVVVNCMVLTEGYDNPNIRTILFARPTASNGLFIQMAGRGTRLAEGKLNVNFVDFVDVMKKNLIVTSSTLIGLDKPIPVEGQDLMGLKEKYEDFLAGHPGADISKIAIEDLDKRIEEVDIFAMAQLPSLVKAESTYSWTQYLDGFKIGMGSEGDVKMLGEIRENALGHFDVSFYTLSPCVPTYRNQYKKFEKKVLASSTGSDKVDALRKADKYIFDNYRHKLALIKQNAAWRSDAPSPKQVQLLEKFGYKNVASLTKGEACNLLSKAFADMDAKRKRRI